MSIQPQTARQTRPTPDDIAPDGQHVVRQEQAPGAEQAAIEHASERQEAASREERAQQPSTRFWSSRRAQVGPVLALLAGVITLGIRTWPIATPQGRGTLGTFWFLAATLVGALYVSGFFLSDRRWKLARAVLIGGAVLHAAVALASGLTVNAQEIAPGLGALLFDLVPATLAIVAAFLITPPPAEMHDDRR